VVVTFEEILTQAIAMLQRLGRVSYRALKVQFQLDDDLLELLKDEIVEVHQLARDQEGTMLVWTGDTTMAPSLPPTPDQEHAPLTYTPPHLVYECLHSHHTQGWRVLESASVSYGKATPYFPVLDLLRRYAHVDDSDDPRTIRAKVTGQLLPLALLQAIAEGTDEALWLCLISYHMCYYFSAMGNHDRAIAAGQRAISLATASGAFDLQIMIQTRLGLVYYGVGDFREALHVSRRVVASLQGKTVPARFG
jgi:hypothetical protein